MAIKTSIIMAIESRASSHYGLWRIGLTHDLAERKHYWKDTEDLSVDYWSDWTADSLSDAQDIESHFINKGMKGGSGGNLSASKTVYLYVF